LPQQLTTFTLSQSRRRFQLQQFPNWCKPRPSLSSGLFPLGWKKMPSSAALKRPREFGNRSRSVDRHSKLIFSRSCTVFESARASSAATLDSENPKTTVKGIDYGLVKKAAVQTASAPTDGKPSPITAREAQAQRRPKRRARKRTPATSWNWPASNSMVVSFVFQRFPRLVRDISRKLARKSNSWSRASRLKRTRPSSSSRWPTR